MEIENLKLQKQIDELIDKIYPIGSYYETSNAGFDPNDEWGGTWVKDTNGYVTVGAVEDYHGSDLAEDGLLIMEGMVIGETHHTLIVDEMPSHDHMLTSWNYYNNGQPATGLKIAKTIDNADYNSSSTEPIGNTGGGMPHNNTQPSIGVYRWHRTA